VTQTLVAERNDRAQSEVIPELKELYSFLATPGIEVKNLTFASVDLVWITWKHAAEEHVPYIEPSDEPKLIETGTN